MKAIEFRASPADYWRSDGPKSADHRTSGNWADHSYPDGGWPENLAIWELVPLRMFSSRPSRGRGRIRGRTTSNLIAFEQSSREACLVPSNMPKDGDLSRCAARSYVRRVSFY